MKSSIRIELDLENNPIIEIKHVSTDDLRDKLVGQFLYNLQHKSNGIAATIFGWHGNDHSSGNPDYSLARILSGKPAIEKLTPVFHEAFEMLEKEKNNTDADK